MSRQFRVRLIKSFYPEKKKRLHRVKCMLASNVPIVKMNNSNITSTVSDHADTCKHSGTCWDGTHMESPREEHDVCQINHAALPVCECVCMCSHQTGYYFLFGWMTDELIKGVCFYRRNVDNLYYQRFTHPIQPWYDSIVTQIFQSIF